MIIKTNLKKNGGLTTALENNLAIFHKIKYKLPIWPTIHTIRYLFKRNENVFHIKMWSENL